ncbi:MAG TPA: cation-transporting P-type ATPase, partial [Nakamurella sp.]|nr:cation-transporting P-type ATPase [Nakamurella sp.]
MSISPESAQVADRPGSPNGLTSAQVAERVALGQVNATSQASSRSLWVIFKTNVFTRFNAILG